MQPLRVLQPNPTHMGRTLFSTEVESARVLGCSHYDSCLSAAVEANWLGWNCTRCPLRTARIAEPDAFPDELVKEVVQKRRNLMDPNGPAARIWAAFLDRNTWNLDQLTERLGSLTRQQIKDGCRTLISHDRIQSIASGIYERVE